jgi:hypothetical protein
MCMCVTIDRIWIGEWIYWPLIPWLGSTNNYNAIADLHNSQIIIASAKPFPASCVFTSHSLVTTSNSGDSSASVLRVYHHSLPRRTLCQIELQHHLFSASLAELNSQLTTPRLVAISHQPPSLLFTDWLSTNWAAPIVFLITPLPTPRRKHCFQQ